MQDAEIADRVMTVLTHVEHPLHGRALAAICMIDPPALSRVLRRLIAAKLVSVYGRRATATELDNSYWLNPNFGFGASF